MRVSVVIPVWQGKEFLKKNLPEVMKLGADEVVVVDDASPDGAGDFVAKNFPKVKLIRQKKNLRFPLTVDRGFAESSGEIVVLLNQDAKPDRGLLAAVLPHFEDKRVGAVTFSDGMNSWACADFEDGFVKYGNGKNTGRAHPSFWASGGASAYRKEVWDKLGGYDAIFTPGYSEDLDTGWQMWRSGYEIMWEPKAKIEHNQPESAFSQVYGKNKLNKLQERNFLIAQWRNLDPDQFPAHVGGVIKRIFKGPGYIVPVMAAFWRVMQYGLKRSKATVKNADFLWRLHKE